MLFGLSENTFPAVPLNISNESILSFIRERNDKGLTANELTSLFKVNKSEKKKIKTFLRSLMASKLIQKVKNRYFIFGSVEAEDNLWKVQGYLLEGDIPKIRTVPSGKEFDYDNTRSHPFLPGDKCEFIINNTRVAIFRKLLRKGSSRFKCQFYNSGDSNFLIPQDYSYLKLPVKSDAPPLKSDSDLILNLSPPKGKSTFFSYRRETTFSSQEYGKYKSKILNENHIPGPFPHKVNEEAEKVPGFVSAKNKTGRLDLTDYPFITIDGNYAKDFDDAVYAVKNSNGYSLFVAIADVSEYVPYESSIDNEAAFRGNSYYFDTSVVPMLPEKLSNNVCSLREGVNRLTLCVRMDLNTEGKLTGKEIFKAVIKSRARVTYEEADKGLSEGNWKKKLLNREIDKLLYLYAELAEVLEKRRLLKGMVNFDFPDTNFIRNKEGLVVDIQPQMQTRSMRIIEMFMLEANEAVGAFCMENKIPVYWRIHPTPRKENLEFAFRQMNVPVSKVKGNEAHLINGVLEKYKNHRLTAEISLHFLKCFPKAEYSVHNAGHFCLASKHYCHFTSPIRRYADLFIHRNVKRFLDGQQPISASNDVAGDISETERNAASAETAISNLSKCLFLKGRIGETFEVIIKKESADFIIVRMKDYFIEGIISKNDLISAGIRINWGNFYDLKSRELALGSLMSVRLINVNMLRLTPEFFPEFALGELRKTSKDRKNTKRHPGKKKMKSSRKKYTSGRR